MSRFVIERLNWRRAGAGWLRLPGENPHEWSDTADEAHACAAVLEAAARRVVGHPFRCGTALRELTTLPDFALLDWLRDAGVDPPDPDPDGTLPWFAWAELGVEAWSAGQLARVWEVANRVRFYRVRESAAEPLHCVVRIDWRPAHFDAGFVPEPEGGSPVALWHSADAATRDCAEKQRLAIDEVAAAAAATGGGGLGFDAGPRVEAANPFADPAAFAPAPVRDVPHCQVVQVERGEPDLGLPVGPLGDRAFVALRLGWAADGDANDVQLYRDDGFGGVPARVFASRADAERWCAEREQLPRETANPFRFPLPNYLHDDLPDGLRRAVQALGLPAPEIDPRTAHQAYPEWAVPLSVWWDRTVSATTPEHVEAVWGWFHEVRFYEVREVRVADHAGELVPRRTRPLYLVRATNWVPHGGPQSSPLRFVGAYTDRGAAEDACREAEQKAQRGVTPLPVHPYHTGGGRWDRFSSLPRDVGLARLKELGILKEATRDFVPHPNWWRDACPRLRESQRVGFYSVFDRLRLYEVVTVEADE